LETILVRSFADVLDERMLNGERVLPCAGREVDAETHFDLESRHQWSAGEWVEWKLVVMCEM